VPPPPSFTPGSVETGDVERDEETDAPLSTLPRCDADIDGVVTTEDADVDADIEDVVPGAAVKVRAQHIDEFGEQVALPQKIPLFKLSNDHSGAEQSVVSH
jgi:hypothetical protein